MSLYIVNSKKIIYYIIDLIIFFVPIFIVNSQFGKVVFKKFNLVPKFFKMYSKWSFLLNITKQRWYLCGTHV